MNMFSDLPIPEKGTSGPGNVLVPSADKQTEKGDSNEATGILRESPNCSNCKQ